MAEHTVAAAPALCLTVHLCHVFFKRTIENCS